MVTMFAGKTVKKLFDAVDQQLEVDLQLLPGPSVSSGLSQIEHQELEKLQSQLEKVRELVKNVDGNGVPSLQQLANLLKEIKRPSETSPSLNLVVVKAIWEYAIILCYYCLLNCSIKSLIESRDVAEYYQLIKASKTKSFLYWLQTAPGNAFAIGHKLLTKVDKIKDAFGWHLALSELIEDIYHDTTNLTFVHSFKFLGLPNQTRNRIRYVAALPRTILRNELNEKLKHVQDENKKYTVKLGELIQSFELTSDKSRASLFNKRVVAVTQFLNLKPDSDICTIAADSAKFCESNNLKHIKKPGFFTRWWATALLVLLYGPSSAIGLWQSRNKIINFLQRNVVDFATGLVYNWVWTPLKNVWATVRHDDDGAIAMMSQETLPSELHSLSRMIVSLVAENSNTQVDTQQLIQEVEHGDLTRFMEIYENQLEKPVKSLISGKLIRSVLIQVQKAKVDSSLALSGIDKMLKSQQLVFGTLAMSPAIIIIYSLSIMTYRFIKLGNIWSNVIAYKLKLSDSFNNIERILNHVELKSDYEDIMFSQGLLVIETHNVLNIGRYVIPKSRKEQWQTDIEELLDFKMPSKNKLNTVNRIYHTFGKYFQV